MRHRFLTLFFAGCVSFGAAAVAQPPALSETIDVDVVNVDVYVSDRKGSPVTGLSESDFQVFEDEKKVKVTNFSALGTTESEPLSVVVYVDGTQLVAANRAAALSGIASALDGRMGEGGPPVMVVYFDGGMRMEQDFTSDAALVGAALHRIEDYTPPPSESQALERPTRTTVDDTMQLFHAGGGSEILSRNTMDTMFQSIRGYGDFLHYHYLAEGKIDAVIESDVNILDIAALTVIVREAGGTFTDLSGKPVGLATRSVLATNGQLHETVRKALAHS